MFAMKIKAICNGASQFTSKKTGVGYHSLLLLVPGEASCLQIGVPSAEAATQHKQGDVIELTLKPRLYNGNLQGLELAL